MCLRTRTRYDVEREEREGSRTGRFILLQRVSLDS